LFLANKRRKLVLTPGYDNHPSRKQETSHSAFFSLEHQMSEQSQTCGVSLWDLLTAISFVVPISTALAEAKASHVRIVGWLLAISIGLVVGACCAVSMRIALLRVGGYLIRANVSVRASLWYSGPMLFGAFTLLLFGGFAGSWLASNLLRLLS
jgi:hypothetical protein